MSVLDVVTHRFKDAERGGLSDPHGREDRTCRQLGEVLAQATACAAFHAVSPSPAELGHVVMLKAILRAGSSVLCQSAWCRHH